MARFEHTINIQQPTEQDFAFLANGENNYKWELEIVESRRLMDGPTRVGRFWESKSKMSAKWLYTNLIKYWLR